MKKRFSLPCIFFSVFLFLSSPSGAQHYKLSQTGNMMGMKSETTIYVKGMRKRTESSGMMGMEKNLVTIEQCDLQRTVKLNVKKKLYFIEPFSTGKEDEVIDEEDAIRPKSKPFVTPKKNDDVVNNQKGGIISMWYSIIDSGERKNMYGFTARHIRTSQKMKPSPDACMMKDSMEIWTDGWYIDLPQFNCPVHYRPSKIQSPQEEKLPPTCKDRFVTHRRGKGKLGFPIKETTSYKMGNANPNGGNMDKSIETKELNVVKLDSMLFEIPPGYQEAGSEGDLKDKINPNDLIKEMVNQYKNGNLQNPNINSKDKKPGIIRIGVFPPTGDDKIQPDMLQLQMIGVLHNNKVEAIAINSDEDARTNNCDFTLHSEFTKIKSAGKLGSILKAIKNINPMVESSFNIAAGLSLNSLADGSMKCQPNVDGKYDGKLDEAAGKALMDGCKDVLKALK